MLNTHLGEGPRTDQSGVIKEDNWPRLNKDPRGLSYIKDLNHLFTMLFLIEGEKPTPFLSVYIFLPCFCLKQIVSLCAFPYMML